MSETKKCLVCERELPLEDGMLDGGGFIRINFGFGSRYDHLAFTNVDRKELSEPLLTASAPVIQGYLCDDCFASKHALLDPYRRECRETMIPIR